MKKIIIVFIISTLSQLCNAQNKSMTFDEAKRLNLYEALDSLYKGGLDSDSTRAIFKDQKAYIQAYQGFLRNFAKFLKLNNFVWAKPSVRCFNKIYFAQNGSVDYFLYNFKDGEISPEQAKSFAELVEQFIKTEQFGLQANVKFAQCSPVKYSD